MMMPEDGNIWKTAEAWLAGTLGEAELAALDQRLAGDPEYAALFREHVDLLRALRDEGKERRFRSMLKAIHEEVKEAGKASPGTRVIPLRRHFLRTAAVAAGMALLTSLVTVWILQSPTVRKGSSYHTLVHMQNDIAKIKNAQYQQHLTISKIKDSLERLAPDAEVNASGTAFALTSDGYLVTNYHVVNGADSVYIRTREGRYFKTFTIAYDEQSDIALLKVEQRHFRFGKGEVPYSFAPGKSPLGARVFSLGFPQREIVYNEGYVSARNGFRSDPGQYRLDLPANPGQSGAPVLDAHGSVIAIVTANESENAGITYAVSTEALHKLLHTLPKQMNIHLPKYNRLGRLSREQQIEKLQDYTCQVQVYK